MGSEPREPTVFPRLGMPTSAGRTTSDLEEAIHSTLVELISAGSRVAFAALFDRTAETVCARITPDIPSHVRRGEILAATYVEVWWLAGCRRVPAETDVMGWIVGIARRRLDDTARGRSELRTPELVDGSRPTYAELEVAALLRRPVGDLLPPREPAADPGWPL